MPSFFLLSRHRSLCLAAIGHWLSSIYSINKAFSLLYITFSWRDFPENFCYSTQMLYKFDKICSHRPIIKATLLENHWTFSSVYRLPLKELSRKFICGSIFIFVKKDENLEVIGHHLRTLISIRIVPFLLYSAFIGST